MKTREDLQLEFEAWFKAHFQPTADLDQVKLAMAKEVARRAYMEGHDQGMIHAGDMEGRGR